MLKVSSLSKGRGEVEIYPCKDLYCVYELGVYRIEYEKENIDFDNLEIYIGESKVEEEQIEKNIEEKKIILSNYRYFEDYFGYISLTINGEKFLFNVSIEKLKLPEVEKIFVYLWKKQEKLLDIFPLNEEEELEVEKKQKNKEEKGAYNFIEHVDKFLKVLDQSYILFLKSPHTVLRSLYKNIDYSPEKITPETVDWIATSLDQVHLDNSFKGHYNAIKIGGRYGFVDVIGTKVNENSVKNYENQIILGSFFIIGRKLKELKRKIAQNIDKETEKISGFRADFKNLKKIPLIKMLQDTENLEVRVKKMQERYKSIFQGVTPRVEKPVLTSVFLQKMHYKRVYAVIKNVNDYNFDVLGSAKLLSINKLSRLYEIYNLYVIIDVIKNKLKLNKFNVKSRYNKKNGVVEKISIEEENTYYNINVYYEHRYCGRTKNHQETQLRRIDTEVGEFYNPDFIIEILNPVENLSKYYIFDAKYSKHHTVKDIYLPELIDKYILKTGVEGVANSKISALSLIFPGSQGEKVIDSDYFEPSVRLISSKPDNMVDIKYYIETILERNLPPDLLAN